MNFHCRGTSAVNKSRICFCKQRTFPDLRTANIDQIFFFRKQKTSPNLPTANKNQFFFADKNIQDSTANKKPFLQTVPNFLPNNIMATSVKKQ
jgi:hypothetical protein